MGDAALLVNDFPKTAAAFGAGRISQAHVRIILEAGTPIETGEARARFESAVVPRAEVESPNRLRPFVKQAAEQMREISFTERHREARETRGAWVRSCEDGMAELVQYGPSAIIHAEHDRLTLTDADDHAAAAHLEGVGPIDPATARILTGNAPGFDRVLTDPVTGSVLAVDRYRPSAEMRRYLRARDRRCRFPGCRMLARLCDGDHTVDHALGGPTEVGNLSDLCRRHHVTKHCTSWKVRQLGGGNLEWTSPTGRTYVDRPPGLATSVTFEDVQERIPQPAPF